VSARSPFAQRLDDGSAPIVGGARRWQGAAPVAAAARFSYPRLDPAASATPPGCEPEPPATFSQNELASAVEAARREACADAEARVRAEMVASREHRAAEALAAIGEALAASRDALAHTLAARAGASRDLALAVARALVAKALALQPLADVEAMFGEVVARLEGHPWLEVRLPPDLVQAGEAALLRAAAAAGYQGEVRVLPEPRLGPGDARIAWQDGAARRDLARLEAEARALVEAWLPAGDDASAPAPAQPDDASTDGFG
jgi:flagellar assembly protein FliH